jgi:hypothetical protein
VAPLALASRHKTHTKSNAHNLKRNSTKKTAHKNKEHTKKRCPQKQTAHKKRCPQKLRALTQKSKELIINAPHKN